MTAATETHRVPDHELLRRTVQGQAEAFSELFRRRRGEVFRFAVHMTGSVPCGEDVVQDVFLVVMREAARYDPARASVSAWLCGIARNCVRQRLAGERRFQPLGDDEEEAGRHEDRGETALETLMREERVSLLRDAVRALPMAYRETLVLCDLQELSYGDAAAALGCPIGTVRSRLHRARVLLSESVRAGRVTAGAEADETGGPAGEPETAGVVTRGCFA